MHPLYSRNATAPMAWAALLMAALLTAPAPCSEITSPRARDLGIPFAGTAGPLNAITDVTGVEVGHATLALGRVGSNGHGGSGDIFLAFSTTNRMTAYWGKEVNHLSMLPDMDPLFEATAQATEEAIINALVAGKTMTGVDGNTVYALPHERVQQILRKYNRLESAP